MPSSRFSFEILFEQMADAVYVLDPETSNVEWGNRAAWESLGLSREAVLHHSVLSLQKDVTGLPQWSEIAAVIRSVPCFTFVGRHRHADGHELEVEVNTTVFVCDGREYFLSVARDISRRLALEAELNKREKQLSFALNEASDGLWDWDVVTGEVFFSPRLKRMLGYGPDEMAPHVETWERNIHPDDLAAVFAQMNAHMSGRIGRYDAEYRLRNRNGDFLWVHDRGRVCERDAAGAPTRVVGMVHDVSERKLAEQKAERLRTYQALIFRLSSSFVKLPLDRIDTAIQEALGEICRFFVVDRGYVISFDGLHGIAVNTHELCAPGISPEIDNMQSLPLNTLAALVEPNQRGEPLVIENVAQLPPGSVKSLLESQGVCSLLTLPLMRDGECIGCVGFDSVHGVRHFGGDEMGLLGLFSGLLSNLAERRQIDERLRESESRFRSLLENVENIAVQGYGPDRRVFFWNAASEKIYGYSRAEALGQHLEDLIIPPKMRTTVLAEIATYFAGGPGIAPGEMTLLRKDGSAVTVFSSYVREKHTGNREMYCVDIDVSERKRVEAELERYRSHLEALVEERTAALTIAKEAAEAASRAKSSFLANMSHELRTPMNAIMGMAGIAQRRTAEPRLLDPLRKIDQAAHHLLGVINDILDISKIEAERLTLERTEFRLTQVFEKIDSLAGYKAREKGLKLDFSLAPALAERPLSGDPLRLGQVLLNLLANAIKFTAQGSIAVNGRVQREDGRSVWLRFEVVDAGIGISSEVQKRLFMAFEQADNSTTRKFGGTGLGLAISKRLVNMMGGEIGVDSIPGQGSVFWFTVCLDYALGAGQMVPVVEQGDAESMLIRRFSGSRLLIAEDEPINREVVLCLLDDVELIVDVAQDGAEAVQLASEQPYALILMDVQMPKLNGLDATRAIRQGGLNRDTPILALTANAFDEDRQRCLEAGMDDHIGKPVNPDHLYAKLLQWLAC